MGYMMNKHLIFSILHAMVVAICVAFIFRHGFDIQNWGLVDYATSMGLVIIGVYNLWASFSCYSGWQGSRNSVEEAHNNDSGTD